MTLWSVTDIEKSFINTAIYKLLDYVKEDPNIEMVFIHITEFSGFDPISLEEFFAKDFVVNILCKDKEKFNSSEAFDNLIPIQKFVNNTFAYLTTWEDKEDITNDKIFKKFFSRSCIVIEKDNECKYLDMWKELQNDLSANERELFYIDIPLVENDIQTEGPKLLKKND